MFLDARGLDSRRMQAIAREMNFSETTFILPAEEGRHRYPDADLHADRELPIAGHPTIGSTFALAHVGVIAQGRSRFVFGLNVGAVPVDLEWDGPRLRFAWMTQLAAVVGSR